MQLTLISNETHLSAEAIRKIRQKYFLLLRSKYERRVNQPNWEKLGT